jgi:hypothetical protein
VILNIPCKIQDDNDHNAHILANKLNKDFRSCFEEVDELELRTTQIQEGENDEHIIALDTINTFLVDMQVPMNWTQVRQLNL